MSVILRRRRFLQLATVSPLVFVSNSNSANSASANQQLPFDHGIGGTGQSLSGESDHGIGGTGIFGTIQRFGSIFVNGHRITYSSDVPIEIDGVRSDQKDLRLGQVVRVLLGGTPDHPSALAIQVTSEVVGPIDRATSRGIAVLSQDIEITSQTHMPERSTFRAGQLVAVYGIRKPDGIIVAGRIERREKDQRMLLRGVAEDRSGLLKVGHLVLDIRSTTFVGRRVALELRKAADKIRVKTIKVEQLIPGLSEGNVSIETYGEGSGAILKVGIGGKVEATAFSGRDSNGHGYINMSVEEGRLVSTNFRSGQTPQSPNPDNKPGLSPEQDNQGGQGPGVNGPKGPPK